MDPVGAETLSAPRRIRVLLNTRSGSRTISLSLLRWMEEAWGAAADITYQLSLNPDDGARKTCRAVAEGIDTIVAVGGDGMVNTIGSRLLGTSTALGVIPAGSGNGFARHFGIPLQWRPAVHALRHADRLEIDVGGANGRPFFVTCSMAWDAALVKWFERSPVRGIFPYIMSAAYGLLEYEPQPFEVEFDNGEQVVFEDPIVFTAANLTQFGGGARIAPMANAHDGLLELVVILRRDVVTVLPKLGCLFDGTMDRVPGVYTRSFRRIRVHRRQPSPVQIDGELLPPAADVVVEVLPQHLTVLVPRGSAPSRR